MSRRGLMIDGHGPALVPMGSRSLHLRGGEDDPVDAAGEKIVKDTAIDVNSLSLDQHVFSKEGCLDRTPVKDILGAGAKGVNSSVTVCGWARTIRIQGAGTFAFIELNDGSTFQSLQASSHFSQNSNSERLEHGPELRPRTRFAASHLSSRPNPPILYASLPVSEITIFHVL
jgi:hypothetical protein